MMGILILLIVSFLAGACVGGRLAMNAIIDDMYEKHRINGSEMEFMKTDDYLKELTSKL